MSDGPKIFLIVMKCNYVNLLQNMLIITTIDVFELHNYDENILQPMYLHVAMSFQNSAITLQV